MTISLHLPARPGAPIACDMSTAVDTPDERLREYRASSRPHCSAASGGPTASSFWFRADPGTREALEELARRESACCPFLDYRVETAGDEVIWTTTNTLTGDERAAIDVFLDALHALPDHPGVVQHRRATFAAAREGSATQQPSPCQASRPSLTATPAIRRPTAGSSHQAPTSALPSRPTSSAPAR